MKDDRFVEADDQLAKLVNYMLDKELQTDARPMVQVLLKRVDALQQKLKRLKP